MNLLQAYQQSILTKQFNNADYKGIVEVDGLSFDIRLVDKNIYLNGLILEDFLKEGMFSVEEQLAFEEQIFKWLKSLTNSRVA